MNFNIAPRHEGDGFRIDVGADGRSHSYLVPTATQQDFNAFFRELAHDFGTRMPHVYSRASQRPEATFPWTPLLTENVDPRILVGYGDPAVLRTDEGWWLIATSNDAPDAIRAIFGGGSPRASSSPPAMSRNGLRKAATSPTSGLPRWPKSGMNIGRSSPPGR
jgi:hypothetical protein